MNIIINEYLDHKYIIQEFNFNFINTLKLKIIFNYGFRKAEKKVLDKI